MYAVRNGTGLTNVRYAGDATQPVTQIPTFNSPTAALGPPRYIEETATAGLRRALYAARAWVLETFGAPVAVGHQQKEPSCLVVKTA